MRPETIEDILITLHEGQWFGFNGEKVYANFWVADGYDKPTEEELNTLLTTKQSEYDAKEYKKDRAVAYASIQDQLDMQYWDSVNGTTTWKDHIAKVKSDNPKP